jgi:hypothetical protein
VIRKNQFYGEKSKHKKGLFYSQLELSRQQIIGTTWWDYLPFELTSNAVKFDVHAAVQFILQKDGL